MDTARLRTLKFFSLLFLLPGLGGLIASAMVSTHYLDTMPHWPVLEENRVIPRGIHGVTVYQTPKEDQKLSRLEYSSVTIFSLGLVLGLVYLENWGSAQARAAEDEKHLARDLG